VIVGAEVYQSASAIPVPVDAVLVGVGSGVIVTDGPSVAWLVLEERAAGLT